ncbi:MAG: GDP-mannose 4,6-dehydratase, partial [Candidatus Sumerlaeaceae bacterium]
IDEFLGLAYHKQFGLPVVIVRLFNTVGPRQTGQYGMVVPRFVEQALRGLPLTVYGDGTQTRAFAYVGDVVEAMIELMETPAAAGQVFNVGNDREISIRELARLVIERTGSSSTIEFIPFEKAYDENFEDLQRRVPDLTKVRALIGYAPKVSIEEILDKVADYMRERL